MLSFVSVFPNCYAFKMRKTGPNWKQRKNIIRNRAANIFFEWISDLIFEAGSENVTLSWGEEWPRTLSLRLGSLNQSSSFSTRIMVRKVLYKCRVYHRMLLHEVHGQAFDSCLGMGRRGRLVTTLKEKLAGLLWEEAAQVVCPVGRNFINHYHNYLMPHIHRRKCLPTH